MIEIHVGNSYSRITGLDAKQEKALRSLLSYTENPQSAYFGRGYARKKSLLSKRCEFPSGLLDRVNDFLIETKIPRKIKWAAKPNGYACPTSLQLQIKPYRAQLDVLECVEMVSRGTISMPTGTGKSLVIAMIHARLARKTLVVVPTLEIKKQLIQSLEDSLTTTEFITVENIDSTALNSLTDFDCLIIDEAHHVAAKTYHKLNKTAWKGIYHRYFLTATPFRNATEEQLLFEAIAGELIYKLDYKTAIREGYIVPVEAYYIELPKQQTDAYTWQEVYSELVVNNKLRNEKIASLLQVLDRPTLCLVKEIKHGHNLCMRNNVPSGSTEIPFVTGSDGTSRTHISDFNSGRLNVLIGTTGILGEGVDTKPCEYVIVAGLGKAKSAFMQQVGRAVRRFPGKESAKVILIKDPSHKFTLRHFREQCKILKEEYGVIPVKLEI